MESSQTPDKTIIPSIGVCRATPTTTRPLCVCRTQLVYWNDDDTQSGITQYGIANFALKT